MVDYLPYSVASMPHDFPLYSNDDQLDFLPTTQPYLPSGDYSVDSTFSTPYDPLATLAEAPRSTHLQYHYDGIAQGVKSGPFQQLSPMGSPHSTSHSFQDPPPVLSASSESCASVSSSAIGSPSINPQFADTWNPMANGLGFVSGFEYHGVVDQVKVPGCVGESFVVPLQVVSVPFITCCPCKSEAQSYPKSLCISTDRNFASILNSSAPMPHFHLFKTVVIGFSLSIFCMCLLSS